MLLIWVEVWSSLIKLGCDVWWPQLANTTSTRPYLAHLTTNTHTFIQLDKVTSELRFNNI